MYATLSKIGGALALVLATLSPAWAVPPGPLGPGMGPGGGMGPHGGLHGREIIDPEMIEHVAGELGVDAKVIGQIKTLTYDANKEAIDIRADMQRAHLELRQLMDEPQPDLKKVMKQVEVVGGIETKLRKNRVQLMLSVHALLTPDQRSKLKGILASRRGPRGMGFGPPGEGD